MRVLVVEDDGRMAGLLRRGLEREGWSVDHAGDAVDATHALDSTPYDVVVCDVGLPGTLGTDWCRALRERGCAVPVLLLTARSGVEARIHGLDCGADDYLGKPFVFGELTARLRALLRRGAVTHAPVLVAGGLRLDPGRHEASWRAEPLTLSPKEFALLEYFLRRGEGMVLTRSEILDHVWDFAYDGTSNVVDVYVRYLRQRLTAAGASPDVIASVRGVGYRLDPDAGTSAGPARGPS